MNALTPEQVKKIFNRDDLDDNFVLELIRLLDEFKDEFKVDTEMRRVRFLAQAVSETGVKSDGTVRIRENLNYSPKGLMTISKFFRKNPSLAYKYGRTQGQKANQVVIGNLMYSDYNRSKSLRLGNVNDGDGYLYRGAGIFQSTGRENITKDIKHLERITGAVLTDLRGNLYNDVLDNYTISIFLGLAHWHRTGMWKLKSTHAITNKINRGLPDEMKKERIANAYRIMHILA